jgi:hypothetical protein
MSPRSEYVPQTEIKSGSLAGNSGPASNFVFRSFMVIAKHDLKSESHDQKKYR